MEIQNNPTSVKMHLRFKPGCFIDNLIKINRINSMKIIDNSVSLKRPHGGKMS